MRETATHWAPSGHRILLILIGTCNTGRDPYLDLDLDLSRVSRLRA